MTIDQTPYGHLVISELIGGTLKTRTYIDFEQREAVEKFAQEFNLDLTQETMPCQTCSVGVITDTWLEELGFCVDCQHAYFDEANA